RRDERPAESLSDEVGPHPVSHVENARLLDDAGHPRLLTEAGAAKQLGAVDDRPEAALRRDDLAHVVGRETRWIAPGRDRLGVLGQEGGDSHRLQYAWRPAGGGTAGRHVSTLPV